MRLWLDCEFNEHGGELISIALVDENNNEWYEVMGCNNPTEWIKSNVMPILNKSSQSKQYIQKSLEQYFEEYREIHVIADWPEDIAYLCNLMITGPGKRIKIPPVMTFEVNRDLIYQSDIPHNALEDAKALKIADGRY